MITYAGFPVKPILSAFRDYMYNLYEHFMPITIYFSTNDKILET